MEIIPVIDLLNGQVVHARFGNRKEYQPIKSQLCKSSDIFDIITSFLEIHPFEKIYIADLNALMLRGDHFILLKKVLDKFIEITFWIDGGFLLTDQLSNKNNFIPVLGSESFTEKGLVKIKDMKKNEFILSLDFSSSKPLGPKELFNSPVSWPKNIIIMTLSHVGSNFGPAFDKLEYYCKKHTNKNVIAAGGIRNSSDLKLLKKTGVTQALIASALHNEAISSIDIQNFRQKNTP